MKVGDTVYRAFDPKDGGGAAPQYLPVVKVEENCFTCEAPYLSATVFKFEDKDKTWYDSYGACHNVCCQLNGYRDAFDYYCHRMGIPDDRREEEMKKQMEMFGCRTYEALLTVIA